MENEQRHYELRSGSRSRSQTPLVQSRALLESEIAEHHYDLRNRSRERSGTPGETVNIKRSGLRSSSGSNSKISDHSMETIAERGKEGTPIRDGSQQTYKKSEDPVIVTKRIETRSERTKVKRGIFANGQKQNKEDSSGRNNGKKHKDTCSRTTLTSDYSSEEGEKEDRLNEPSSAHEIYKQAGDWWNVFPKTDYTYSKQSQCRYEIAPGVLAMPNMSRRSIHSDSNSSNQLSSMSESGLYETANTEEGRETNAQNRTSLDECHRSLPESRTINSDVKSSVQSRTMHVEQYQCRREAIYTMPGIAVTSLLRRITQSGATSSCDASRKRVVYSLDSDTELDEATPTSSKPNGRRRVTRQFTSFTTSIVLWFNKLLEFLKLKTVRRREHYVSTEYGKHESTWYKIWRTVDRCLHYVYLFLVKVFFFDSWLLSRVSNVRRWIRQRSSKLFWIALLPLIVLTGCWCLPYLATLFPSTKVITRHIRETSSILFTSDKQLFPKTEDVGTSWNLGNADDFKLMTEKLNGRIDGLEDRTIEQSNQLLNISKVLERLKENDIVWSKYNYKMETLEKKLEEHHLDKAYSNEIETIKLQLKTLKELYSELKSCCDSHSRLLTEQNLENRIEMIVAKYFDGSASKKETVKIIQNLAVGSGEKDSETLGETVSKVEDDRVRKIVKEALKVYDADKTGRVDYALESAGGQIISTRCTQRYDVRTRAFKLLAFTLYHENNNPRTVIQGNPIQPGACWAFQGFPGYLLIKLRGFIYVTGFTVEHAPKSILPNGEMTSAPRKFNVWGFIDENDSVPVMFGDYEFSASDDSLQYFPVQNTTIDRPYEYIELRVHSNHGQLEYTCLYRFRVHGRPV